MKKLVSIVCMLSITATMLVACGNSDNAGAEQPAETEAPVQDSSLQEDAAETEGASVAGGRTTFTVGFDAEFPPYGYKDDSGEYVGFDLDLARAVCEKNGWEFVAQPIDWDAKDMELSSGSIDCIWNGFTMNGREEDYTWSVPYIDNSQVFVVPAEGGMDYQYGNGGGQE